LFKQKIQLYLDRERGVRIFFKKRYLFESESLEYLSFFDSLDVDALLGRCNRSTWISAGAPLLLSSSGQLDRARTSISFGGKITLFLKNCDRFFFFRQNFFFFKLSFFSGKLKSNLFRFKKILQFLFFSDLSHRRNPTNPLRILFLKRRALNEFLKGVAVQPAKLRLPPVTAGSETAGQPAVRLCDGVRLAGLTKFSFKSLKDPNKKTCLH